MDCSSRSKALSPSTHRIPERCPRNDDGATVIRALDAAEHRKDDATGAAEPALSMTDDVIGRYKLLEPLGHGAMGVVYRARHIETGQAVALKTVRVPTARWLDSIRREVFALNRIHHPGIVRIVDHGTHRGRPWYAMMLLEGETLRHFKDRIWSAFYRPTIPLGPTEMASRTEPVSGLGALVRQQENVGSEQRPLPPARSLPPCAARELPTVLRIARRLCATLAFLHGEGFVNCDLKPENVLLVRGEPVIIDFGLAAYHPGSSSREAFDGRRGIAGTLPYMSPEQLRAEFPDARSDLYAVGCVLYELITSVPPFVGTASQVLTQHLSFSPLPPSALVEGVPDALERIVMKLLKKDVIDRFGHADEVAGELATLGGIERELPDFPRPRPYLYRPRFVGREDALRWLTELRQSAAKGKGAFALLGGESGVGKTRVAMELARACEAGSMRVVTSEVFSLSPDGAAPFTPVPLDTVRPLLRTLADCCQEGGAEITDALLGERRAVLSIYEPLLEFVPAAHPLPPVLPLAWEAWRARLFEYLRLTLIAFARQQALFWIIDDIHRADELSLEFLTSLEPEFFRENPIFVLGTYRSEESNERLRPLFAAAHVERRPLPRLDDASVAAIIGDMLALSDPAHPFVDHIAREAEGNPFFVAEYLRAAVSEAMLYRGPSDTWQIRGLPIGPATENRDAVALPGSLRELIAHRIERMGLPAQYVAQAAAVLGRESALTVVSRVADISEEAFTAAIDELMRRQILESTDAGVRFAHDKLREVAYSYRPERQRELHSRAANYYEAELHDQPGPRGVWASAGHHFALAGEATRSARYYRLAAEYAASAYAHAEAIRLYREALRQFALARTGSDGNADGEDAFFSEVAESLADLLSTTGQRVDARRQYDAALAATTDDHSVRRARLHRKLGRTFEADHHDEEARHCYDRGLALIGSELEAASAELRREWLHVQLDKLYNFYFLHQVPEMNEVVEQLRKPLELYGLPAHRARFYQGLTMRDMRRDRYRIKEETLAFARAAVAECENGGVTIELPFVRFALGFALLFHGAIESAEHELKGSLALARRASDAVLEARCFTYLAVAERRRGRVPEVEIYVTRSLETSTGAATKEYLGAAQANRSWLKLQARDDNGAVHFAEEALATWRDFRPNFPFQWLALIPLLDVSQRRADRATVNRCVDKLLESTQQALPDAATAALEAARAGNAAEHRRLALALREFDHLQFRD